MMKQVFIGSVFYFFLFGIAAVGQTLDFEEELVVCQLTEPIQFALNTRSVIATDSAGTVHIVYFVSVPSSSPPSYEIRYQTIREGHVSEPVRVDNGKILGGRHPSLAVDNTDTVHVVWHDYRHSTESGTWMDNVEIYYDRKSPSEGFLNDDIRITYTNADHNGDNGFLPKIAVSSDNRIHIVWYDFNANGNNADVYLRTSTEEGEFPLAEGIDQFRITSIAEGGAPGSPWSPGDEFSSAWVPSLAVFPDGDLYTLWGFLAGFQGILEIQGGVISRNGTLGAIEIVAEKGGMSTDPPRLTHDDNGNLGLAYMNRIESQSRIQFQYRPYENTWSNPIFIDGGDLDASQPDVVFGADNDMYVIYQEDVGGIFQVSLATINLENMTVDSRHVLSGIDFDARTPALAIEKVTGRLHVAWIEQSFDNEWTIKYRRQQLTGVKQWRIYSNK